MIRRALAFLVFVSLVRPFPADAQPVAVGEKRLVAVTNMLVDGSWRLYALFSDFHGNNDAPVLLAESPTGGPWQAAVASDGENFLAAWVDSDGTTTEIRAAIVGGGEFTVAEGIDIPPHEINPIVKSTSTGYVVIWQTPEGIGVAEISTAGAIVARHTIAGVGRVGAAAMEPAPVLLSVRQTSKIVLEAIFLGSDWTPAKTVTVATMPVSAGYGMTFIADPQLAWNGNQYYATWTTIRGGRYVHVEGTRLTLDGAVLDAVETCETGPAGACGTATRRAGRLLYNGCCDMRSDALLASGSRFLKAWEGAGRWSSHELQGSWIDVDGRPSRPVSFRRTTVDGYDGTVALLPNGQPVIVTIVGNAVELQRIGSSRRRAVRAE
jgi:hypothetical protein